MPTQFIRKVTLIVADAAGNGLDLSELRIVFETTQSDFETLNTLTARIYNLSDDTAQTIQKEYTNITLQAGYKDGTLAVVFQGSIKQVKRGRESQTETYVEIFAADGDLFYTQATVAKTLAKGWKQEDVPPAVAQAADDDSIPIDLGNIQFASITNPAPRGKVLFGVSRLQMRKMANSTLTSWSIQNGKITVTPLTGYQDSEAVPLNSLTGLIGLPEQTEDGLAVTCLLNPRIQIGTQIQINQAEVQKATIPNDLAFLSEDKSQLDQTQFFPPTSADGFYKVLVSEHRGDTRGNDYYTDIIALSIDKSAPQNESVKLAG